MKSHRLLILVLLAEALAPDFAFAQFANSLIFGPLIYPPQHDDPPQHTSADPHPAQVHIEPGLPTERPLRQSTPDVRYFCPGPKLYYPNVTDCSEGWQAVAPQGPRF